MSSNCHSLSDDWGWYVDIESLKYDTQSMTDVVKINNKNKYHNKLETIDEDDEYNYYVDNQKNLEELNELEKIDEKHIEKRNIYLLKNLFKISSTTMITALLTYVIFFVL